MSENRFSCPACNRSYAWKPEMAGRPAKCKCGHSMTVPAEPPQAAAELAPQNVAAAISGQAQCPSCGQRLPAQAVLCVDCGYDLRTGKKVSTEISSPEPAPATAAPAPASTRRTAAVSAYPISRRPVQEEPAGSTTKYVILGGVVLLVAMGVGGWIIFSGTGGGKANRPLLGDDARVEEMISDEYPKDLTEWVEANPARMLGGKTARQAAAMETDLKAKGATKVLAFGAGVMCLCIAIELPDDPAKRKALFDWHNENVPFGEERTKDVGQRYILHSVGL